MSDTDDILAEIDRKLASITIEERIEHAHERDGRQRDLKEWSKRGKLAGHKCLGAVIGYHVGCECGWGSNDWYSTNARHNAYGEWRYHKEQVGDSPGHKAGKPVVGYHVNCECGWSSAHWLSKGSRAEAYKEWRYHIDKVKAGRK